MSHELSRVRNLSIPYVRGASAQILPKHQEKQVALRSFDYTFFTTKPSTVWKIILEFSRFASCMKAYYMFCFTFFSVQSWSTYYSHIAYQLLLTRACLGICHRSQADYYGLAFVISSKLEPWNVILFVFCNTSWWNTSIFTSLLACTSSRFMLYHKTKHWYATYWIDLYFSRRSRALFHSIRDSAIYLFTTFLFHIVAATLVADPLIAERLPHSGLLASDWTISRYHWLVFLNEGLYCWDDFHFKAGIENTDLVALVRLTPSTCTSSILGLESVIRSETYGTSSVSPLLQYFRTAFSSLSASP